MSGVLGWVRDSPCIRQDRCLHLKSGYHGARTGWGTFNMHKKSKKGKAKKKKVRLDNSVKRSDPPHPTIAHCVT